MQDLHRNTTKRRDQGNVDNIDDVFKRGTVDDMRRICSSLEKYDSGHSSYNTTEGFLMKLPDDECDQIRMYQWCIDMGFLPADDTLPVMKLQAPKVGS